MTATGTEARVCQDIADRQARGIAKYGTTVEGNPLGLLQWYKHHYEELLDAAVYVKRIIELMEGVQAPFVDAEKAWEPEPPEARPAYWEAFKESDYGKAHSTALEAIDKNIREVKDALSATLEDGSTLTASGPQQNDPHAELRKTWKPGQRWQFRNAPLTRKWTDLREDPLWHPDNEYRRHPDDKDPQAPTEDVSKPVEDERPVFTADEFHKFWGVNDEWEFRESPGHSWRVGSGKGPAFAYGFQYRFAKSWKVSGGTDTNSRSFEEARERERIQQQGWFGYCGDAGG